MPSSGAIAFAYSFSPEKKRLFFRKLASDSPDSSRSHQGSRSAAEVSGPGQTGGAEMKKIAFLVVTTLLSACSSMSENRLTLSAVDEASHPQLLNCGLGSKPVCRATGKHADGSVTNCRCERLPYMLGESQPGRTRIRRH